jgi:uncharacterized protein (TIGR03083 family)
MTTADATVTTTEGWDASQYANKAHLLRVVHESAAEFFALVEAPENWNVQINPKWEVRDLPAHMVDVIEGYLNAFRIARGGEEPAAPWGTRVMGALLDEHAQAFRSESREALLRRLHQDYDQLMEIFDGLDENDWGGLTPCHPYMGPVPSFCYPAFQLMDYGVHAWDVREALRQPHGLSPDVADFLVPFMFSLMQGVHDAEKVPSLPAPVGLKVSGRNGGSWKATVIDGSLQFEQAEVDDLPVVFDFDPCSFVLNTFGRTRAGTGYGDIQLADRFRDMFFPF